MKRPLDEEELDALLYEYSILLSAKEGVDAQLKDVKEKLAAIAMTDAANSRATFHTKKYEVEVKTGARYKWDENGVTKLGTQESAIYALISHPMKVNTAKIDSLPDELRTALLAYADIKPGVTTIKLKKIEEPA